MKAKEYYAWQPTYDLYEKNWPDADPVELQGKELKQYLALTGLVSEATEAMTILHKDLRNRRDFRYDMVKDELSDVWWYFNKCLHAFDLTLSELSEHNKQKLDARNA